MSTIQMSVWVPVIAALAGGLIASIAPIFVGVIQSRTERSRELLRLATQLAVEENRAALELIKFMGRNASISPIALNLAYHVGLLKLLSEGRPIAPEAVAALKTRTNELFPK
jgi:hypothetical protein